MKTVAEVIGVSRSNLAERQQERPQSRIGRPPLPDGELVAQIKVLIGELPTYGRMPSQRTLNTCAKTLKPMAGVLWTGYDVFLAMGGGGEEDF
jgi:hypothetical protein